MAIYEQSALLRRKDQNGNEHLLYPITKFDCVDGLDEAFEDVYAKLESFGSGSNSGAGSGSGPIDQVQSDWNQNDETAVDFIKNKPFGETTETVTFLDGEYRYYFDEANGFWTHDAIPFISDARLSIGANATVTWDGTVYECECYEYPGFGLAVGSHVPLTGEDDGIPFIIVEDINGLNTGTPGFVFALVVDPDQTVTTEVTVAIKLESQITIVKQIDPKYVDVSWGGLPDKPFYHNTGTEAILEETTLPFDVDTAGGAYVGEASKSLILGQTYIVTWDGQEYEYTAELFNGGSAIGDLQTFMPFGIMMQGGILVIRTTFAESSHTISITRKYDDLKTIDPKYLPETVKSAFYSTLFPSQTLSFTPFVDGAYFHPVIKVPFHFVEGESYIVVFDGVEYATTETADDNGAIMIGNLKSLTDTDNGMPFSATTKNGELLWLAHDDSETHTVAIYKRNELSGSGPIDQVQSDWNQNDETAVDFIKNKPDILDYTPPTTDLRPTKTIVTDELHPGFNMYYMEEQDSGYTLKAGETYMVEWDGVTYTCVGIDVSAVFGIPGSVAIGNGAAAGLPGNNEPFIIGKFNDDWKGYIPLTDTTIGGSHTVRIYRVNEVLPPTVKPECLPLLEHLKSKTIDVLPTKTLTDFELHSLTGWYEVSEEDDSYSLTAGETYTVEWDGTGYECIAQDIGGGLFPDGTVALGDGTDIGAQGNGEPFFLGQIGGGNRKRYYSQTDSSTGASHTVRIFKVLGGGSYTEGYKIKPEYLPTLHYTHPVNELLPKKTFTGFTQDSQWGLYQVNEEDPGYTLKAGETYMVEWDGHVYECVGQDVSAIFGVTGSVAIGNGALVGLPSNNEPFIIGKFNGDWKGYISTTDTTGDKSHTVRIYQLNDNSGYKIKEEYIPEFTRKTLLREQPIPCYHFAQDTYIGFGPLASFEFIAGETYIVMFDGVEYKSKAFANDNDYTMIGSEVFDASAPFVISLNDNGYVACIVKDPSEYHTIGIYQRVRAGGSQNSLVEQLVAEIAALKSTIASLQARVLPEVTAEDEGKFLRVVNGVWTSVEVESAEEVSF
jgi:hypothetical protein